MSFQASTVFINEVFKQIPADTGARRLASLKVGRVPMETGSCFLADGQPYNIRTSR
jgi:hypothetical protein